MLDFSVSWAAHTCDFVRIIILGAVGMMAMHGQVTPSKIEAQSRPAARPEFDVAPSGLAGAAALPRFVNLIRTDLLSLTGAYRNTFDWRTTFNPTNSPTDQPFRYLKGTTS
jgi:hypothetical protein